MRRSQRFLAIAAGCAILAAPVHAAAPPADGLYNVVIQWPPHSPWQHLA
jgi:hypothetical protein